MGMEWMITAKDPIVQHEEINGIPMDENDNSKGLNGKPWVQHEPEKGIITATQPKE